MAPFSFAFLRKLQTVDVVNLRLWAIGLIGCLLAGCSPPNVIPVKTQQPASMAKLSIDGEGMVAIKLSALASAGLGWTNSDLAHLRLFYQGQAEPIWIDGQGADATLKFYAQASQGRYSRESIYFLQPSDQSTQLMSTLKLDAASLSPIDHYSATLHAEENHIYSPQVTDGDHWFWAQIPAPQSKTFTLTLDSLSAGASHLQVEVWGSTAAPTKPNHHLLISINGQKIADETFSGIDRHTLEAEVPDGSLRAGDNLVQIAAPGDTGAIADIVFVDWIELRYSRQAVAQDDQLEFDGLGGLLRPIGFSGPIEIFDITDPDRVTHVDQSSAEIVGMLNHRYAVIGPLGYRSARVARAATVPDLRASGNGADYIAIGPTDLLTPLQPLLDWHSTQGLKASAVPLDAVFDQFDNGLPEPEAIRAFLQYAEAHWAPAPKYILLVGDATYDPLGYSASADGERLPTFLVQTIYGGETASDVAFVQLNADSPLPDLAIGRVPARTADQVQAWVNKSLAYERSAPSGEWRQHILAVADGQDPSFGSEAQNFLKAFPKNYQTTLVDPPPNGVDGSQPVISQFDSGNLLVAYFGHGSLTQWSKDNLLTADDIASLGNGDRLPVVLNMTCLTGLFTHPKVQSLAEALLWQPNGGAVAVLAPTSLTLPSDQSFLNSALIAGYLADPTVPLGQLLLNAWRKIPIDNPGTLDVLRTFLLFGDPALRLVQP